MAYTMYTPLNVWLDPASVTDVVAYIQAYLRDNPISTTEEIEELIHDYLEAHPELIGGVQSVNGKTGTVVLSASDINTANNVTIESVLASLSSQISSIAASVATNTSNITNLTGRVTTAETDISALKSSFIEKKNLFAGITTGKYSVAWNVGNTVSFADGANYAYGIADVEGLSNVTINLINMSDAYSFFTDAQNKKVATSADNRVGTSRVYNVPSGAKYFYVSSSDITTWTQYGFVMLEGTDNIVTNPVSTSQYPYDTTMFFADNLKLSTGITVGEALETASKVYHVEKDGSGDYDSLVAAIQEAVKYNNSIVYVGAGTWDIVDELGSTYMEAVTSNPLTWGLELKNNIHIIGTAKTIIQARYTGTTQNTREYFSVFNAGAYGFTLENVKIVADNIRYIIHDDRGSGGSTPYVNKFINCDMKLTSGYYGDTVIGGGLGINGTIEIRNCRLEGSAGTHRLAYYHGNNYQGETGAKCTIIVQGCYFAGDGSFDVTKYGDSTEMSTAYLSNNSFGSAPQVTSGSYAPQDNMQIVAWNNEIRT